MSFGHVILLEDVGDELGLAVLLEDVGDELGLVVPLTALAIGIGCRDIGQYLRREDDVIGSDPPPPVQIRARERSRLWK